MIKQNWNIDNEESRRILSLHENATKKLYLIKEQMDSKITVDFGSTFPSGRFELTNKNSKDITDRVMKIVNFAKGNQLKNLKLNIVSGESLVPNQPPFNKERGSLAKARSEELKNYLLSVLPRLLNFTPEIVISQPVIGTEKFDPTKDNKDAEKYTREQFVNVVIDASKSNDLSRKSSVEETIYLKNRVVALIEKPLSDSKSVSDAGNLDINRNDLLFKVVKPDTQPPEVIKGQTYKIPWSWWNENVGPSKTIDQGLYDYITSPPPKENFPSF
jgi:hypothetical protein